MNIKQLLLVTAFNLSSTALAMELATHENNVAPLPSDVLRLIFTQVQHDYPWQSFKCVRQLARVCTSWQKAAEDTKTITQLLNIPPMHYAAMTNNADEIIKLTLADHSPLEPTTFNNKCGLIPALFAFACNAHDALIMLKVGSSLGSPKIRQTNITTTI